MFLFKMGLSKASTLCNNGKSCTDNFIRKRGLTINFQIFNIEWLMRFYQHKRNFFCYDASHIICVQDG